MNHEDLIQLGLSKNESLAYIALVKFKEADAHSIIKETKKALRNKGKFVFCRYIPHFEKYLEKHFLRIYMEFVPLNIPTSLIYICEK